MLNSEKENCVFEPEAGSLSRTIDYTIKKLNKDINLAEMLNEHDPEEYIKKLGKDLQKRYPQVYKEGIIKRAKLLIKQERFNDALNILYQGFNVDSLKKHYDPKYMQRFFAE